MEMKADRPQEKDLEIIAKALENRSETVILHGLGLTAVPPEIGKLSNLTSLYLSHNKLTSLPPEIGKLSKLTHLEITGNQLRTLPPQIGDLHNLRILELACNQLMYLPRQMGKLSELNTLNIRNNQLFRLPVSLRGLKRLKHLHLANNPDLIYPPAEMVSGHGWLNTLDYIKDHYDHTPLTTFEKRMYVWNSVRLIYIAQRDTNCVSTFGKLPKELLWKIEQWVVHQSDLKAPTDKTYDEYRGFIDISSEDEESFSEESFSEEFLSW